VKELGVSQVVIEKSDSAEVELTGDLLSSDMNTLPPHGSPDNAKKYHEQPCLLCAHLRC